MARLFFYLGVFTLTFSSLMLELAETRLLSVQSWYHLAFFIISLAMFGLTAGAIYVYFRGKRFTPETVHRDARRFATYFALSVAAALAMKMLFYLSASLSVMSVVAWFAFSLCLAVPFFLAGVATCLVLTRSPYPVGRVYAVDLIGAACGCLGVLGLLSFLDGPSAILGIGACAALAAAFFGLSDMRSRGARGSVLVGPLVVFVALTTAAITNTNAKDGLYPLFVKGYQQPRDDTLLYERWNAFSRIAAYRFDSDLPPLWGPSERLKKEWKKEIPTIALNIDGLASTPMYDYGEALTGANFLRYDIVNLAYFLPGRDSVAVIGVGGGKDVLSAKVFGAKKVVGVEINPVFIDLLTKREPFTSFAKIAGLPGVDFKVEEARSWFAASKRKFDLVQMSLIDTWAATGAGAFTLSENGLYTVEAWKAFLSRLTPRGVYTVSRWFAPGMVNETGRMVSLAVATLLDMGIKNPASHIYLASGGPIATIVVSRQPMGPGYVKRLDQAVKRFGYETLAAPGRAPATETLAAILNADSIAALNRLAEGQPLDISPPTDDRPFFFNQLHWNRPGEMIDILTSERPQGVATGNLEAALTLLTVLIVSLLLTAATLIAPLKSALAASKPRLVAGGTAYFFLIGFGFMAVEIGLVQRMSVFLGHPIYSLSVALFSLILAAGAGSALSEKVPLSNPLRFGIWACLSAIFMFASPWLLPPLFAAFSASGLMARALVCVAVLAPLGLAMGFGFPSGMRLVQAVDTGPTPWFWGINGAAGVLASTMAVALSIAFGIHVTIMAGSICYALTIPAVRAIGFSTQA